MYCAVCGNREINTGGCTRCHGFACAVCGQPVYRDESYAKTARGLVHVRCSDGKAFARPAWMVAPQSVRDRRDAVETTAVQIETTGVQVEMTGVQVGPSRDNGGPGRARERL